MVLAVVLAALVATFNGLSSAQLAASHPVSGGTYEYDCRYLNPALGFTAGWMFSCAKSASAATAALGFAGYVLVAAGASATSYRVALALLAVVIMTIVVAGFRRLCSGALQGPRGRLSELRANAGAEMRRVDLKCDCNASIAHQRLR